MVIVARWFWLVVIIARWFWLVVIVARWFWLVVIVARWYLACGNRCQVVFGDCSSVVIAWWCLASSFLL